MSEPLCYFIDKLLVIFRLLNNSASHHFNLRNVFILTLNTEDFILVIKLLLVLQTNRKVELRVSNFLWKHLRGRFQS